MTSQLILNLLNPAQLAQQFEGFQRLDQGIVSGLPHAINLDQGYQLVVFIPTGLASTWRDADPMLLISTSENERAPISLVEPQPVGAFGRSPARLFLRQNDQFLGSIPLAAGYHALLPESEAISVEIIILGWALHAGTLRGVGDFGSRFSLAWRLVNKASDTFSSPAVHPAVTKRSGQT